jgi:hypothetical protein
MKSLCGAVLVAALLCLLASVSAANEAKHAIKLNEMVTNYMLKMEDDLQGCVALQTEEDSIQRRVLVIVILLAFGIVLLVAMTWVDSVQDRQFANRLVVDIKLHAARRKLSWAQFEKWFQVLPVFDVTATEQVYRSNLLLKASDVADMTSASEEDWSSLLEKTSAPSFKLLLLLNALDRVQHALELAAATGSGTTQAQDVTIHLLFPSSANGNGPHQASVSVAPSVIEAPHATVLMEAAK